MTGYDRSAFGPAWADTDHNGCDTRNDMLRRDLDPVSVERGTDGCVVLSGRLDDPYTGSKMRFVRGVGTSSRVQIDHVVALGDSWQKGAQQWTDSRREAFANDPLNLLSVNGSVNESKGDGDTATWLPPNKSFRCAYVARQVSVKRKYALSVTVAEKAAMHRILATCPNRPLVSENAATHQKADTATTITKPAPSPRSTPSSAPEAGPPTDPRFDSCGDAIEQGYGPYDEGKDPEYHWYQDGDHDGVVCER